MQHTMPPHAMDVELPMHDQTGSLDFPRPATAGVCPWFILWMLTPVNALANRGPPAHIAHRFTAVFIG
jgi:hypothetical protein